MPRRRSTAKAFSLALILTLGWGSPRPAHAKPAHHSLLPGWEPSKVVADLSDLLETEPPPNKIDPKVLLKLRDYGKETVVLTDGNGKRYKTTTQKPIFTVRCSPSGKLAVVGIGFGRYEVCSLDLCAKIKDLPKLKVPASTETWDWLDENTLIGIATTELNEAPTDAAEKAHWRGKTFIFTYALDRSRLTTVNPALLGLPASFHIIETRQARSLKAEWIGTDGTPKLKWVAVGDLVRLPQVPD